MRMPNRLILTRSLISARALVRRGMTAYAGDSVSGGSKGMANEAPAPLQTTDI